MMTPPEKADQVDRHPKNFVDGLQSAVRLHGAPVRCRVGTLWDHDGHQPMMHWYLADGHVYQIVFMPEPSLHEATVKAQQLARTVRRTLAEAGCAVDNGGPSRQQRRQKARRRGR